MPLNVLSNPIPFGTKIWTIWTPAVVRGVILENINPFSCSLDVL